VLLALLIIENSDQSNLLFWEINFAANLCLFLKEITELIKIILEPILILIDALVLISVALFESWRHTRVCYVVVQLVEMGALSHVHSQLTTFLNYDDVFHYVVYANVKLFLVSFLVKQLQIDVR
jgi:hypothetical protein